MFQIQFNSISLKEKTKPLGHPFFIFKVGIMPLSHCSKDLVRRDTLNALHSS
jgi:hypothetical protein